MLGLEKGLAGRRRAIVRVLSVLVVVSGWATFAVWAASYLNAAYVLPAEAVGFGLLVLAMRYGRLVAWKSLGPRALPLAGFLVLAMQIDPVSAFALSFFGLIFAFALIALVVSAVYWKGAKMSHRVIMAAITVGLFALVILGAAAQLPSAPGGSTGSGGGVGTATLHWTAVLSADTTASNPGSPFTACTSQNVLSSNGAKTTAGVVITNATILAGSQSDTTSPYVPYQYIRYTGDAAAVTGGGGKMAQTCAQMKITFQYTTAVNPTGAQGSAYFPIYVYLTNIQYSGPSTNLNFAGTGFPGNQAYSNGSLVNVPIWSNSYVGTNAFPVIVKDGAGTWDTGGVCPNLVGVNTQFMTAMPTCNGQNVNQNPTTNSISFYVDIDPSAAGMFGYAATDAAVGTTVTLSFQAGLPSSLCQTVNGQCWYTPQMFQWTVQYQRTGA